ncbi:unnamed protein product [Calicophoron daubneyi]|uniref:Phenylalanyl-tRNA synthetase alpha subunit n=2 Tax=Calicophoron daubneyi TaxID=300641 RepID=A0AAV2TFM8_CALDB
MSGIVQAILLELENSDELSSISLSDKLKVDHQVVVGGIKSLQSLGEIILCQQVTESAYELTEEGKQIVENGSHEYRVYCSVPQEGISQKELMEKVPNAKIGLSKALAAKWVSLSKDSQDGPRIYRLADSVEDSVRQSLLAASSQKGELPRPLQNELKKRKLLVEVKHTSFTIKKGPSFTTKIGKEETDLTPEMLLNGSWKTAQFKSYNFKALGAALPSGHLHPLLRVRSEFCKILEDMGFSEMPTNNYVECSFWNFDSLFQPQQHPARDVQDTFFVADPATTNLDKLVPKDYLERVRTVHTQGAYGSRGYQSEWLESEAEKNVLRTHTTAVSSRMLYALANQPASNTGRGSILCGD